MQTLTINIKELTKTKPKSMSTVIIGLLKRRGISGKVATELYQKHSPEYILRKNWLLDYQVSLGLPVKDHRRWLQAAIKNDYNEPDHFLSWLKKKKAKIIKNGDDDLKRLI